MLQFHLLSLRDAANFIKEIKYRLTATARLYYPELGIEE